MVTRILLILFSCVIVALIYTVSHERRPSKSHVLTASVVKDRATNLYFSTIYFGNKPSVSTSLVLDLTGHVTWYDCSSTNYSSSSYSALKFGSPKCKLIGEHTVSLDCAVGVPVTPGCSNSSCGLYLYNPVKSTVIMGSLGQDTAGLYSLGSGSQLSTRSQVTFACVSPGRIDGFPSGVRGLMAMSKNVLALPGQITSAFKIPRKFALCLPSKPDKSVSGQLFIGGGPYVLPPYSRDASRLFNTTKLITNRVSTAVLQDKDKPSDEYFIDVKSIEIDGKAIPLTTSLLSIDKKGNGGTKLSTVDPYTILHTSIYEPFVDDFKAKAKAKKMVQVAPVAPFGACFRSESVGRRTNTGPDVPIIHLVLKSGGAWRIHGSNSMVAVDDDVMCLAFVNGGRIPRTAIILGGYQMEDNLIEIDNESSKLRFTSSLLLHNTSCSQRRRTL